MNIRTRSAENSEESIVDSIEEAIVSDESTWNKHSNRRTLVIVGIICAVCSSFYAFVSLAPAQFPQDTIVTIPAGANLTKAADFLEEQHVVTSGWWLKRIIQLKGKANRVYAGDYLFKTPTSIFDVANRITTGAFGLEAVKIVIPEGATVKEIAKILDKKLAHFSPEIFIEEGEKFEGYLFPDTYFVLPNIKEQEMLKVLKSTLETKIEPYKAQMAKSHHSLHEILTIASILEKEESDKKDRHMIAGVLENRLAINMALQVDATFLYILGRGTFGLSREDLKNQSPYNTYVHRGLPPGPINNPGITTIAAVLNPTKNPYIFYLADQHGTTYYSTTYAEHLAKKREYIDNVRR